MKGDRIFNTAVYAVFDLLGKFHLVSFFIF